MIDSLGVFAICNQELAWLASRLWQTALLVPEERSVEVSPTKVSGQAAQPPGGSCYERSGFDKLNHRRPVIERLQRSEDQSKWERLNRRRVSCYERSGFDKLNHRRPVIERLQRSEDQSKWERLNRRRVSCYERLGFDKLNHRCPVIERLQRSEDQSK